jgi:hypothetical protein
MRARAETEVLAGGLRGFLWFGKSACGSVSPIYHLLASKTARVVEWQTRTFEGRMPKGMRVQVPPRAPPFCSLTRGNTSTYLPRKWTSQREEQVELLRRNQEIQ